MNKRGKLVVRSLYKSKSVRIFFQYRLVAYTENFFEESGLTKDCCNFTKTQKLTVRLNYFSTSKIASRDRLLCCNKSYVSLCYLQFISLFSRNMSYVQLLTRIKCVGTSRIRIKFRGSGKMFATLISVMVCYTGQVNEKDDLKMSQA